MTHALRLPLPLIGLWAGFLLLAGGSYLTAFVEPYRSTYSPPQPTSNTAPTVRALRSYGMAEGALAAQTAERHPAQLWAKLAPTAELEATHLPGGTPPFSAAQVAWGSALFERTWSDARPGCATCHLPEWGFGSARSDGAPALLDHLESPRYREADGWLQLRQRVEAALLAPEEVGFESLDAAMRTLAGAEAEPIHANSADVIDALTSFLVVQRPMQSAWDRWQAGISGALTPLQLEGKELFFGAAGCATCHPAPSFAAAESRSLRDLETRPPYGAAGTHTSFRAFLAEHASAPFRNADALAALAAFLRGLQSERALPFLPSRAPSAAQLR